MSPNKTNVSPKRQNKNSAPIETAIFAFNKLPINELIKEERDYIPKELNIQPEDVNNGPKGIISNQSNELLINEELKFNPLGLINQGRKVKDGVIIFGKVKVSIYYNMFCSKLIK